MSFYLFKLRFTAAVHFGSSEGALNLYSSEETFRADTLFSALCHTALALGGEAALQELVDMARAGSLRFSDAMPYCGETLYLPKPCANGESRAELPPEKRKAMKKLRWLPLEDFPAFSDSLRGGIPFVIRGTPKFGIHSERTGANVQEGEDTLPYQMGSYHFFPECGLWFLCDCPEAYFSRLSDLVEALGLSGIGGKTSSGFGSFALYDDAVELDYPFDAQTDWLHAALYADGPAFLLLTTALPKDEELENTLDGASFQLIRRGGFVRSETHSDRPMKKVTQYYLSAGAVLARPFEGDVFEVGGSGTHPVYRYAKPIFLGVAL